jgi:hypothetical protein
MLGGLLIGDPMPSGLLIGDPNDIMSYHLLSDEFFFTQTGRPAGFDKTQTRLFEKFVRDHPDVLNFDAMAGIGRSLSCDR